MKKFIGIPCHFRGVGEFAEMKADGSKVALIFPMIIENQSAGFRVCYRKAEFLFARLAASTERFRDWVALGNVNLDDLVDVECRAISDFENNFRLSQNNAMEIRLHGPVERVTCISASLSKLSFFFVQAIKRRGRAAEELPNEIRIDCFTVNCIPVKNTIEQLLQNLFDALLNCLRRSVQADLVAADAFLTGAISFTTNTSFRQYPSISCPFTDALEKLSQRPQTVEEMSEATARHAELAKGQARLTEQLNCAEDKDRLLKNVSGAGVGALAATRAKWDKFQLMMESFKLMMNEQIEVIYFSAVFSFVFLTLQVLKSNMESRLKVFFGNLEKFAARWYQLRPSTELLHSGDRKQGLEAVQVIRTRKEEFGEMEETLNGLLYVYRKLYRGSKTFPTSIHIRQDCKHFDMAPPNCSLAEELRNNFVELETMWSVYEKFALEVQELSKEDWISFRSRTYVFEEFLSRWFDQLRSEQPSSITAILMKEIDQYRVSFLSD
ncbi:unnamed protein product [Dibothriocephalus latus]|uniref:Dynein heavy chain tail domain-containing protein n=1 Tax=Dibothriocephalus latus TaxID=60516 RepID=A0A3P7NRG2_DIBLA|nr:unnamed protein product [Dibothriocephalus latus]